MKKIPHRLYLTEEQMPRQWYNLRADMPEQPDPLRDPATGKVLATRAGKSHLLSSMSRKRKRNLRGTKTLGNKEQAKTVKSLLQS